MKRIPEPEAGIALLAWALERVAEQASHKARAIGGWEAIARLAVEASPNLRARLK